MKEYDKSWEDIHNAEKLKLEFYSKDYPEFIEKLKKVSGREK